MELTESRKDFLSHDLDYYKNLYKIYTKDNDIALYMGSINCDKIIKVYKDEKNDKEKELDKLNENVKDFEKERDKKIKKDDGEYERYHKDKEIRNQQKQINDDIKEIYENEILPYQDKFPEEVKTIEDATKILKA